MLRKVRILSILIALVASSIAGTSPSKAVSPEVSKIVVQSSEPTTTNIENGVLKVYLSTFRPKTTVFFKVNFNNPAVSKITSGSTSLEIPANGTIQFNFTSGVTLDQALIDTPIKIIKDEAGNDLIEIYPAPSNFPKLSFTGNISLIEKREILSTPVVNGGTYAIASTGKKINFFIFSRNNLLGFRKVSDTDPIVSLSGSAQYAYLVQKDFSVTATSPGVWRVLDRDFALIQQINEVTTKFGDLYPEGHGMTTSPSGNAVVITTPERKVDSSWLKRQYKAEVLDCDIAEVKNGKAIKEFSWWDWANAHRSQTQALLDQMPLFNDPQDPQNSPIDICHANSLQYYAPLDVYLVSLRSPSILLVIKSDLKTVKYLIPANDALQHFARFVSKTEITAFGNYTNGKVSRFQDFKLVNGTWKLKEYEFPVHVLFCANANFVGSKHVWLGGGCGPARAGLLGALYQISGNTLKEVGAVNMENLTYSYRADLF